MVDAIWWVLKCELKIFTHYVYLLLFFHVLLATIFLVPDLLNSIHIMCIVT